MTVLTEKHPALGAFMKDAGAVKARLASLADEKDLTAIQDQIDNFKMKTEEFYRKGRKLNIGVIGQVKAGKSSFLNTLLFGGQEVLPKASTPKTATLTRMEYAEKNRIHIDYYSEADWKLLEKNAAVDSDEAVFVSAKELVEAARRNGLDTASLLEKGAEDVDFASYEDLVNHLNDYVGENGMYTPVVKAVTLYLHNDRFKDISIVDTPGMNDPVHSRTLKTQEFMELCDVVFFLSQTSNFLDQSDWELLSTQLPQKGVKRMILVASKYDSGLRDVLRSPAAEDDPFGSDDENTASDIPAAIALVGEKLSKRAKSKTEEFLRDADCRGFSESLISVIKQCEKPVLVSAMAENMSRKAKEDYTKEEQNVYHGLAGFSDNLEADLKRIGNFDAVRALYDQVAREKEEILQKKAAEFVPTAREALRQSLAQFKKKADQRAALLEKGDKKKLEEARKAAEDQMGSVQGDIRAVFTDLMAHLEEKKSEGIQAIRSRSKDYTQLKERTGTKTHEESYEVDDSGFWPWTWGDSHTEYYTVEEHYNYCLASDMTTQIQAYMTDSVNRIEKVFQEAIRVKEVRRKLQEVVLKNFDAGSTDYNVAFFQAAIEGALQNVTFPVFHLNVSDTLQQIEMDFSGEVTSAKEKNALAGAVRSALHTVYDGLCTQMEKETAAFHDKLKEMSGQVEEQLLANVQNEYQKLSSQCEDKEKEVARYQAYSAALTKEIGSLA